MKKTLLTALIAMIFIASAHAGRPIAPASSAGKGGLAVAGIILPEKNVTPTPLLTVIPADSNKDLAAIVGCAAGTVLSGGVCVDLIKVNEFKPWSTNFIGQVKYDVSQSLIAIVEPDSSINLYNRNMYQYNASVTPLVVVTPSGFAETHVWTTCAGVNVFITPVIQFNANQTVSVIDWNITETGQIQFACR